jgi:hypothetical protein
MSEPEGNPRPALTSLLAVAFVFVLCCAGLPLLVATGVSVAAFARIGGVALGLAALVIAGALLVVRARKAASTAAGDCRSAEGRR